MESKKSETSRTKSVSKWVGWAGPRESNSMTRSLDSAAEAPAERQRWNPAMARRTAVKIETVRVDDDADNGRRWLKSRRKVAQRQW